MYIHGNCNPVWPLATASTGQDRWPLLCLRHVDRQTNYKITFYHSTDSCPGSWGPNWVKYSRLLYTGIPGSQSRYLAFVYTHDTASLTKAPSKPIVVTDDNSKLIRSTSWRQFTHSDCFMRTSMAWTLHTIDIRRRHSFMQRPVHLSFGQVICVEILVDG